MKSRTPFHLVDFSPWPLTGSMGALFLTIGLASWMHGLGALLMIIGLLLIGLTMVQWWRDIIRESTFQGHHTKKVKQGLSLGMILFIVSEVCFFFSFFWAYFHSSLAPSVEIGCKWAPAGITPLNPFEVPLLNTGVLLTSGLTVTWAHHSVMEGDRYSGLQGLALTVLLGCYFSVLQAGEYYEAPFTIADGVYGSTFYVTTGFHGLHVLIGTVFLIVCMARLYMHHFLAYHHFGLEAAIWYWHFVDVVWLFLYLTIYWWGS